MTDSQSQPCPPVTFVEDKVKGSSVKRKSGGLDKGEAPKRLCLEEQKGAESTPEDRGDPQQSILLNSSRTETCSTQNLSWMFLEDGGSSGSPGLRARVPDIHRTGAKCVPGAPPDPLHAGEGYHNTGVLRLKPGRGEPTLSLSCSDKLARWGVLGFQGALLSHYLQEALYFTTVVVGKCPYSQEAMHRALVTRWAVKHAKTNLGSGQFVILFVFI